MPEEQCVDLKLRVSKVPRHRILIWTQAIFVLPYNALWLQGDCVRDILRGVLLGVPCDINWLAGESRSGSATPAFHCTRK